MPAPGHNSPPEQLVLRDTSETHTRGRRIFNMLAREAAAAPPPPPPAPPAAAAALQIGFAYPVIRGIDGGEDATETWTHVRSAVCSALRLGGHTDGNLRTVLKNAAAVRKYGS